jgi:hypothetical protein
VPPHWAHPVELSGLWVQVLPSTWTGIQTPELPNVTIGCRQSSFYYSSHWCPTSFDAPTTCRIFDQRFGRSSPPTERSPLDQYHHHCLPLQKSFCFLGQQPHLLQSPMHHRKQGKKQCTWCLSHLLPQPPQCRMPQLPSRQGTPNCTFSRRPRNLPFHPQSAVTQEASRCNKGHPIRIMHVTDDAQVLSVQPKQPQHVQTVFGRVFDLSNTQQSWWRGSPDRPPPPYMRAQSQQSHRTQMPSPYPNYGPHLTNVDNRYY